MKQIRKIRITKLSLQGFKGFAQTASFTFDDIAVINGDNGQGKSSILEAIVYAFTGCTFWGDNKNERLINTGSKKMRVDISFTDENGNSHTLSRRRIGNNSSIAMNGITVRQTDLTEMFGEKDCFLSIVNPLYFIEHMADTTGRDFLLKLLPAVSHEDVLLSLDEYHRSLLENESLLDPANYIKNRRAKIREQEDNRTYIQGQIDTHSKKMAVKLPSLEELESRLSACRSKLDEIEAKKPKPADASVLEGKKLAFKAELDALNQRQPELKDCAPTEIRLTELRGQRTLLKSKNYTSGITDMLNGIELELQKLRQEWNRLDGLTHSITSGSKCPTCLQHISEEHVAHVKVDMHKEKEILKTSAEPLIKRREWLLSQDKESCKNFEDRLNEDLKACEDEITRLSRELQAMKSENATIIKNFSDKKTESIHSLEKKIAELDGQISSVKTDAANQILAYEKAVSPKKDSILKEIDELQALKHAKRESELSSMEVSRLSEWLKTIDSDIETMNRKIIAAIEYAAKRAELTLKPLKMDRVKIKLQEVVKSTGEIINTFRFTYDGKDYRILSLSEKIRAGLEVSNLIQELTQRNYPVLVDNAESISVIDNLELQGQVIFSRVVAGAKLSVKSLSPCQEDTVLPLRKAG
ncbi:MAG: hypothetical protein FIA99_11185 [Ruminiclostridium sp.]|nr:hypothetical protein [Ruminiclostridium sp.]